MAVNTINHEDDRFDGVYVWLSESSSAADMQVIC